MAVLTTLYYRVRAILRVEDDRDHTASEAVDLHRAREEANITTRFTPKTSIVIRMDCQVV